MERAARCSSRGRIATGLLLAVHASMSTCIALAAAPALQSSVRHSTAVADLERWYGDTVDDCGGVGMPAYQCSGILLRATRTAAGFQPWEPSDQQTAKGSIAFSWLRQDDGFGRPYGRQNGFILYPNHEVPHGQLGTLQILCSFPITASTNSRPTLQGCGPMAAHVYTTDTCQRLGVTTAAQWLDRYAGAKEYQVCGWDLRHVRAEESARWFKLAAEAHQGLPDARWSINNEVLVSAWPKGSGGRLPLHSFFRVQGAREALVKAQHDQIQYFQRHGRVIPIVQLAFPASKQERMSFSYDVHDQAVGQPTQRGSADFEEVAVGQHTRVTAGGFEFELSGDHAAVSDRAHPASAGLISGRHLSVDSSVSIALEGAGHRRVAFSWGCNRPCFLQKLISDEQIMLFEQETGEMGYGTMEFTLEGPEALVLVIGNEEDDTALVLDNLQVRELAHRAR